MITNKSDWLRQDYETGQWFRVLIRGGGDFIHQVEIPLTPSIHSAKHWKTVGDVFIIRTDMRDVTTKDKSRWTHTLPMDVAERMSLALGIPEADFLFNGDIYPLIDWKKFSQCESAGVPLKECRRDYNWRFEQTVIKDGLLSTDYVSDQTFSFMNAIHTTPDMLLVGGVSALLGEQDLLIYGYYHLTTGYVCFDLNCSIEGQHHTSKFSQRLKPKWETGLVEFIENMKLNNNITENVETAIKSMIWVANNNLMGFKL